MKQRFYGWILIAALIAGCFFGGIARADGEIEEASKQVEEDEKGQKEIEEKAAELQALSDALQEELDGAYAEIDAIIAGLLELDGQIEEAEAQIRVEQAKREKKLKELEGQKDAMALRIQYMYEQQYSSLWEVLAGAKSLGEIINSAEYISSITSYDNQMMEVYKAELAEIEADLEEIKDREAELRKIRLDMQIKQEECAEKTEEIIAKIDEYNTKIAEYGEAAAAAEAKAAEDRAQLEKLQAAAAAAAAAAEARRKAEEEEARRAAEEARRKAEEAEAASRAAEESRAAQQTQSAQTTAPPATQAPTQAPTEPPVTEAPTEPLATQAPTETPPEESTPEETEPTTEAPKPGNWAYNNARGVGSVNIDPDEVTPNGHTNLELLAAIIDLEAGGQPYEGRIAVGNVIWNRILDPRFQMTIYDVIYAPNQFTPAYTGNLDILLARGGTRESSFATARDCFNGARSIPERFLYFSAENQWDWVLQWMEIHETLQIGNHIFYY